MQRQICIQCGRPVTIGNFCEACFLRKNELFNVNNLQIYLCDCNSYYDGKWQKPQPREDIIRTIVEKNIVSQNIILKRFISFKEIGNRVYATIECHGFIKPSKRIKIEKKKMILIIKKRKCENCVKISGGYYEAVIQIRGKNAEKILKIVKKLLLNELNIASINKIKEGYDIKLIKKGYASKIAKQLKNAFIVKESYKFVTTKKDKKLYRNYYAIL